MDNPETTPKISKKPLYKKWWFWGLATFGLMVLGANAAPEQASVTTQYPVSSQIEESTDPVQTIPAAEVPSGQATSEVKKPQAIAPTFNPPTASHSDKDCGDFSSRSAAQAYFDANGGSPSNNFDNLDADHDGLACESLN